MPNTKPDLVGRSGLPGPITRAPPFVVRRHRAVAVLLACALSGAAERAARADEAEPVHLSYEAPAVCPDAEAFVKEVHARTARFRLVPAAAGVRSFRVRIAASAERFSGTMRIVDRSGAPSAHSVEDPRCEEVARALAFIAALSIDPAASVAAPPAPVAAARPLPTPPTTSPASASALAPPPAPPASPAAVTFSPPDAAAVPVAPRESPPAAPPAANWRLTGGAGVFAEGLGAPGAVLGEAFFLAVGFDAPHPFSPELRAALAHARSGTLDAGPGHADLEWTVARVDLCPVRWTGPSGLGFRPCATGDGGTLSATAAGVGHPQSRVRPWATVGALGRLEWAPVGPLVVEADFSLVAPLVRESFFVAPTPNVYHAPAVAPAGALAVGVRFP